MLWQEVPVKNGVNQKKNKKWCQTKYWGLEDTLVLINLWSQEELLFNIKLSRYLGKVSPNNTIHRIVLALRDHDTDVSAEEVASKMHGLCVDFSAKRNKQVNSKYNGAGTDDFI